MRWFFPLTMLLLACDCCRHWRVRSQPDADKFFAKYDPKSSGRKFSTVGPNKPSFPGDEANLDVQYGMSMAAGVQNSVFWVRSVRFARCFQRCLDRLLALSLLSRCELPDLFRSRFVVEFSTRPAASPTRPPRTTSPTCRHACFLPARCVALLPAADADADDRRATASAC